MWGSARGALCALAHERVEREARALVGLDGYLHVYQAAVLIHDELAALEAVLLGIPGPIQVRHRGVGVHQQREGQIVLGLKRLVRRLAIRADAQHDGVALGDLRIGVAEAARLERAARGVVHRIEVDDYPPATQVREPHEVAVFVGQGEIWREIAYFELVRYWL